MFAAIKGEQPVSHRRLPPCDLHPYAHDVQYQGLQAAHLLQARLCLCGHHGSVLLHQRILGVSMHVLRSTVSFLFLFTLNKFILNYRLAFI